MKVAIKRCDGYDQKNVYGAIKESLELIGGLGEFIKPGERVLIKPNLLMPSAPERAAITHPEVVRALIRLLKEFGALPAIGECPGGVFSPAYLRAVYSQCGIAKVAKEENCPVMLDFTELPVESPGAKVEKRPIIASFYKEYDRIISVAKIKTHGFMGYSGAVKNMFGAVPGAYKAEYHLRYSKIEDFAAAIVDIYQAVTPTISIIDAIIGMEGDGPSGGVPRKVGAVLAGANGHEVDFVAAGMIGMNPYLPPIAADAISRGLLIPDEIARVGDNFTPISDYAMASNHKSWLKLGSGKGFMRWVMKKVLQTYPRFVFSKCTGCGICAKNCPPKAIAMVESRPRLSKKTCISCLCCHELCPSQAIDIKRFMGARM